MSNPIFLTVEEHPFNERTSVYVATRRLAGAITDHLEWTGRRGMNLRCELVDHAVNDWTYLRVVEMIDPAGLVVAWTKRTLRR